MAKVKKSAQAPRLGDKANIPRLHQLSSGVSRSGAPRAIDIQFGPVGRARPFCHPKQ